jgi:hypothetical protein
MNMASSPPQSQVNTISFSISSWQIHFHAFSSSEREHRHHHVDGGAGDGDGAADASTAGERGAEGILLISTPLSELFNTEVHTQFDLKDEETKSMARGARVALADYAARMLSRLLPVDADVKIETLGRAKHSRAAPSPKSRRGRKMPGKKEVEIPYVLERTDCIIASDDGGVLQFHLHVSKPDVQSANAHSCDMKDLLSGSLLPMLDQLKETLASRECFGHIAAVVLQRQLRGMLQPPREVNGNRSTKASSESDSKKYLNAVAFIADDSILPRKSGRSHQPMSCPPAIPFQSPESDMLTRTVEVEVGWWRQFLNDDGTLASTDNNSMDCTDDITKPTAVTIRGMIIPLGVTLIVGGGYHGKSTLLQSISCGIYDKSPSSGLERCVTHPDALSIRAEDGRYVNKCNVSGFIANLPKGGDTTTFSTRDASGSTSQASNVVEGLESGASAFLVDEDVSVSGDQVLDVQSRGILTSSDFTLSCVKQAANFMARDGRMRAMIMDEPIT